jgi:hypothetical protein
VTPLSTFTRLATLLGALLSLSATAASDPHNVILFVPDGLRAGMVTAGQAPAMAALAQQGVRFGNSHALFPTFTTANASGFATGHYLGDTGDFSNTIYVGFMVPNAANSVTPFIESDPVLGDLDRHFAGNYLDEGTILEAAHARGFNTAAIGKLGPTLIFSHRQRDGLATVVIDDRTGQADGVKLAPWLIEALQSKGLPLQAPGRGDNSKTGDQVTPGTLSANIAQQTYFTQVVDQILLPRFKQAGKPFMLVYWSRDPDGSQHNQGDSLGQLTPGINGPTSLAGIRNADDQLAALRATLVTLGLDHTTDIIVAADHGFSTISKQSHSSGAAQTQFDDVPAGQLPPGFLALDLAVALDLPLLDPDADNAPVGAGRHSKYGNGLLGEDPSHPLLVVAANGGSDLIYLPPPVKPGLAARTIAALLRQDYVSGLFVDDKLGSFAGTLPLSAIDLVGAAVTPHPSIVVNFRSESTGCADAKLCSAEVADTGLQQGQGMHGSFGRADSFNFMAAVGPDFKTGMIDPLPVSNADVGRTLFALLDLPYRPHGKLVGRVMTEALVGGQVGTAESKILRSRPTPDGLVTLLRLQRLGNQLYFDSAGFAGRTVGLDQPPSP